MLGEKEKGLLNQAKRKNHSSTQTFKWLVPLWETVDICQGTKLPR